MFDHKLEQNWNRLSNQRPELFQFRSKFKPIKLTLPQPALLQIHGQGAVV